MNYQGVKVMVTGGAGFVGSHLADRLVEEGARVTVLDDLSYGHRKNVHPNARFVMADIRDYPSFKAAVEDQEVIFHLAACATTKESSMGWADPAYDYEVNAIGTLNLLRAVTEEKTGASIVFTSSAAVYGVIRYTPIDESHPTDPVSPYGVSKLTAEKYCLAYCREHGIPVTVTRIFNAYGPRQPRYVMHDFIMKLRQDPDVLRIIGDGKQTRDFCYIDDAVEALLLAAPQHGEVINIAHGVPTTIMELTERIIQEVAPGADVVSAEDTWRGDIPTLLGNSDKLRSLGWSPKVDLANGIKRLVASYDFAPAPGGVPAKI